MKRSPLLDQRKARKSTSQLLAQMGRTSVLWSGCGLVDGSPGPQLACSVPACLGRVGVSDIADIMMWPSKAALGLLPSTSHFWCFFKAVQLLPSKAVTSEGEGGGTRGFSFTRCFT